MHLRLIVVGSFTLLEPPIHLLLHIDIFCGFGSLLHILTPRSLELDVFSWILQPWHSSQCAPMMLDVHSS